MKQIPLSMGPEPAMSFDNLLPGPNAAAVVHLASLAVGAPPVYLWGAEGSGKTHLLHAATDRALAEGQRAVFLGADVPAPWSLPERCDRYAIDDCQRLDEAQQAAAFSVFVAAQANGAVVVAAGTVPPVDLAAFGLREDLRTRLGWGHVFALAPLAEPDVRSAMRREADRRGTFLSDDVMDYLLTRHARDLKHLMALLDRLDTYSLSTQRPITVALLKRMEGEEDA